jgi:hypothetical protein
MTSVTEQTIIHKTPIAYYGWLRDQHGVFLQAGGIVSFRDSATETWHSVDLETLTTWAVLNGRVDIADAQALADGNRVRQCSQTLSAA